MFVARPLATLTSARVGKTWLSTCARLKQKNLFGDNLSSGFVGVKARQMMFKIDNGLR